MYRLSQNRTLWSELQSCEFYIRGEILSLHSLIRTETDVKIDADDDKNAKITIGVIWRERRKKINCIRICGVFYKPEKQLFLLVDGNKPPKQQQ